MWLFQRSQTQPLPVSDYTHNRPMWSGECAQQFPVSRVVFVLISGLIGITTGRWEVFCERGEIQTQIWKRQGAVPVSATRWRRRKINAELITVNDLYFLYLWTN